MNRKERVTRLVGSTLGKRYEIIEKLGEGGMAIVYRGHDGLLDRTVAIKVLRPQFAADADFVERFRREAQAAASLSHPNVVNIFDVGTDDNDVHYIVMEYVEGRNIKDILRTEGRLPLADALFVAREVCRALAVAHRQHLIHRDIKPHNILVTNDRQVKVTDFGIARAASSATLTQTGTVLGSVHYLSPEQALGGQVGVASDVYAVGVLLYEMLTGQVPFEGDSPVAVALKHLHDTPVAPSESRAEVPSELNDLVLQAMAKKPEDRFETVTLMWQALRAISAAVPGFKEDDDTLPGTTLLIAPGLQPEGAGLASAANVPASTTDEITIVHQLPGRDGSARAVSAGAEHKEEDALAEKDRKRSGGKRFLIWVLLLFAFAGGVVWAGITLFDSLFPPELQVPSVVGSTLDDAQSALQAVGLTLRVTHEIFSDRPVNTVIRQVPEAGRSVKAGREIEVQISIGKEVVPVPNLMALSEREAGLRLEQSGLTPTAEAEYVYRPDVPPNIVVGQDPPAGDRVLRDSPVLLVLSTGAPAVPEVDMPNFVAMSLAEALVLAEQLGLVVGDTYAEPDPRFQPGHVVDQMPPAGVPTEVGSVVSFVYTPLVTAAETEAPETDTGGTSQTGPSLAGTTGDGQLAAGNGLPGTSTPDSSVANDDKDALQQALITVTIPPGPSQELEIVVIDSISARRVYQGVHRGDTRTTHIVSGSGPDAMYQVWIGGELRDHGFIKEAR